MGNVNVYLMYDEKGNPIDHFKRLDYDDVIIGEDYKVFNGTNGYVVYNIKSKELVESTDSYNRYKLTVGPYKIVPYEKEPKKEPTKFDIEQAIIMRILSGQN